VQFAVTLTPTATTIAGKKDKYTSGAATTVGGLGVSDRVVDGGRVWAKLARRTPLKAITLKG
jgi:hypothetical protein